ncbi:MAG TPA: isoleucine--tRNA ligase [Acidisoma sp.]|uniref:isoleucine--tRNA ligase n=1 Tax=Acidisoma sp. TaxID=1872115 RepID=UPI002B54FA16|nr:isoleucine--tRNA ligase [Acidisoma sp.]HTI03264.1 isoleucine--tRNA ligase [Acidisoma sp.]
MNDTVTQGDAASAAKDAAPDYRKTVFLPRTPFPMKGDLPKREPAMLATWEKTALWERVRAESKGKAPFVLHDGPPYANGNLHLGHALNKVLKDAINRAHQMAGFDAHFIPGWDCHGLPIEWKVEEGHRKAGRNKDEIPVLQFRAECRAYAEKWLGIQADEFKRLGIMGDWAARYATMDFTSEAAIAAEIGRFLMNGALYRGLRPVMWSPVEKTALAEAEIEYHDHKSVTIWVRFPVLSGGPAEIAGSSIIIWTTTPWTMPGNRAIAYGPEIDYLLLEVTEAAEGARAKTGERLMVAEALLGAFLKETGITGHALIGRFKGEDLAGTVTAHPLRGQGYDYDVPLLPAEYVTTEAGTGFVHTAPTHGEDDFILGRAHGLEVPDTVGDDGTYNEWVPLFAGIHVFKAAEPVCRALEDAGGLLHRNVLVHSYPHSWRSKAPVIYRATPQWFIRMDGPENIRGKALQAIAETKFIPEQGRNRIASMVAARPDWCVSRQRAWGVPIAIFVDRRTGEPLRDPAVMARIVDYFKTEGADAWYARPASDFLGNDYDATQYEQVRDIIDVWFESGSTHAFVLEARGLPWPADLYLEGSDQHRGWFHSSLLEAVGTRGRAPFKAVLTHGFLVDEQGRKMSKSLGNGVEPQDVIEKYGADILRLWVMSSDARDDLSIGPEILKQQGELYRRLRNTLRWLLGSLDGFSESEILPVAELPELERWVLHRLTELDTTLRAAVENHDWTGVYPAIHHFCATDLSAYYFDIRKDALYCDRPDSLRRRAARTVLDQLHRCLTTWLAPVLVFTAEEAWQTRFGPETSVHTQLFPVLPAEWRDEALAEKWARVRDIRRLGTTKLEAMRQDGQIGASLQAEVTLAFPDGEDRLLSAADWADALIVSAVHLTAGDAIAAEATLAAGEKCARCWRVLPEVDSETKLCLRCADAVAAAAVASGLTCQPAG